MNRRRGLHRRVQLGLAIASVSAFAISTTRAQTPVLAGPLLNPANGHAYYLLAEDDWQRSEATAVTGGEHFVHMLNSANEYGHPGGFWNDLASPNTTFSTFNPVCGLEASVLLPAPDAVAFRAFRVQARHGTR